MGWLYLKTRGFLFVCLFLQFVLFSFVFVVGNVTGAKLADISWSSGSVLKHATKHKKRGEAKHLPRICFSESEVNPGLATSWD